MAVPRKVIVDLVQNDIAPPLPIRFEGLDLADYTTREMHIKYSDGTTATKTVVPDAGGDPELGHVTFTGSDLKVGEHEAEFELDGMTLPRRYSVTLNVRAELG